MTPHVWLVLAAICFALAALLSFIRDTPVPVLALVALGLFFATLAQLG